MLNSSTTIVSCPGKVLLSGGYLVLDRAYTGVVIGTASRFYTIIRASRNQHPSNLRPQQINLTIRSPQFLQAEWSYSINVTPELDLIIKSNSSSSSNKFVELAVRESLKLSLALQSADQFVIEAIAPAQTIHDSQRKPYDVTIIILGDNDFYSQPRQDHNAAVTPFNRLNTSLKEVHKTGLGSSAAMVTSLCSAILVHFTHTIDPKSKASQILLHNLSQYVHSLAQGKIGSGFDVSAALWGTHIYKRFSPECLSQLLESNDDKHRTTPHQLRDILDPKINSAWTDPSTAPSFEPFSIPKYTTLLMADVDAGSHTPSMVAQVLRWRTHQSELANKIWTQLSVRNEQLKLSFKRLEQLSLVDDREYLSNVLKLIQDSNFHSQNDDRPVSETDNVMELFVKISSLTKSLRKLMKDMGVQSDVPIEPDSQTKLLDQCEKLDGVIGTGVPGAGGYDAIWVLVFTPPSASNSEEGKREEKSTTIQTLINFLNSWPHSSVRVLSSDSWVVGGSRGDRINETSHPSDPSQVAGLDSDGIQIFHDVQLVDRLKSQRDLFA